MIAFENQGDALAEDGEGQQDHDEAVSHVCFLVPLVLFLVTSGFINVNVIVHLEDRPGVEETESIGLPDLVIQILRAPSMSVIANPRSCNHLTLVSFARSVSLPDVRADFSDDNKTVFSSSDKVSKYFSILFL